jgi:hypothetical protein
MSPNLGGWEVWIDWEGGSVGSIISPVGTVFLQLHDERTNIIPLITAYKDLSRELPTLFMLFQTVL